MSNAQLPQKSKLEIAVQYLTLVVAALWAVLGFYYTWKKDTADTQLKKYALIEDLFEKCASNDQDDQRKTQQFFSMYSNGLLDNHFIVEVFGTIDEFKRMGTACVTAVSNQLADRTLHQPSANPSDAEIKKAADIAPIKEPIPAQGPMTPSASPNDGQRFWIYLGTYQAGRWITKYINVKDSFDPTSFTAASDPQKGIYKSLGALNVRFGEFSNTGDFPPPYGHPLTRDQQVQLKSTAQWFDSGNWWATIDPPKPF